VLQTELPLSGLLPSRDVNLPSVQPTSIAYSDLSLIGQLHGTYLLCEAKERLILVDQHAAHERVGFEELKAAYAAERLVAEPLLMPLHFDLLPSDAAILEPSLSALEAIGVEIARFGGNTFIIQAVPSLLKDANWNELIGDVIEDLKEFGTLSGLDEHLDDLLATMACHRQIRAHDRLEREEMQALLSQLGKIDFAYTCPHGRPAAVEVSLVEIEKWFKRRL
jgi:DNA mismatch repair protein MutL